MTTRRKRHHHKKEFDAAMGRSGISAKTLAAMKQVDRKRFVPQAVRSKAYNDHPLPLGEGATISQPSLVGRMIDYLKLETISMVLELGTGSGYNAEIISKLIPYGHLVTVERLGKLAKKAANTLRASNVTVIAADATKLEPEHPYDRIIVTAEFMTESQMEHYVMKNAGIFCIAVYPLDGQLWRLTKCGSHISKEKLIGVRFIPVITD